MNFDFQSDNESVNDVASVTCSNGSFDDENNGSGEDSQTFAEKHEEKLLQSIENATEKSTQIRIQALQNICQIFQHNHIPEFVEDRKVTVADIVEKSLRRGKREEQEWAARLSSLLILQIGGDDSISKILTIQLSTTLQVIFSTISSCVMLIYNELIYN